MPTFGGVPGLIVSCELAVCARNFFGNYPDEVRVPGAVTLAGAVCEVVPCRAAVLEEVHPAMGVRQLLGHIEQHPVHRQDEARVAGSKTPEGPSEPQEAGPIRGSPFRIVRYQQLSDIEALGDSEPIPRMPEPACQAGPIAPALSSPLCLGARGMEWRHFGKCGDDLAPSRGNMDIGGLTHDLLHLPEGSSTDNVSIMHLHRRMVVPDGWAAKRRRRDPRLTVSAIR